MEAKTIGNFGGPYEDATAVENPETDLDADNGNLLLEAAAQMTRTSTKAEVSFDTVAAAAPQAIVPTSHDTQWGSGASQRPTVGKTATGLYTVTWGTSFNDALGTSETVAFTRGKCEVRINHDTDDIFARIKAISSNVVTLLVESPKGTAADVGNVSGLVLTVDLFMRG